MTSDGQVPEPITCKLPLALCQLLLMILQEGVSSSMGYVGTKWFLILTLLDGMGLLLPSRTVTTVMRNMPQVLIQPCANLSTMTPAKSRALFCPEQQVHHLQ